MVTCVKARGHSPAFPCQRPHLALGSHLPSPPTSPATPWHRISFSRPGSEDVYAPPWPLTLPRPQPGVCLEPWCQLSLTAARRSGRPDRPCGALGPRKVPQGPWKGWERLRGPEFGSPAPLHVDNLPGRPSSPPPAGVVSGQSGQEPGVRWARGWAGASLSVLPPMCQGPGVGVGDLVCNGDGVSAQGGETLGDDDGNGCAPV